MEWERGGLCCFSLVAIHRERDEGRDVMKVLDLL